MSAAVEVRHRAAPNRRTRLENLLGLGAAALLAVLLLGVAEAAVWVLVDPFTAALTLAGVVFAASGVVVARTLPEVIEGRRILSSETERQR